MEGKHGGSIEQQGESMSGSMQQQEPTRLHHSLVSLPLIIITKQLPHRCGNIGLLTCPNMLK